MNAYRFDEMKLGLSAGFTKIITEDMMKKFAEISGDYNPLHIDMHYASNHGYRDKVVYGMLTASLYSTLVGMYLPGERCLLNSCNVRYIKPVYVEDCIEVYGEVSDIRAGTRRIKVNGKMTNQDGIVVNSADIMVSFTE